MPLPMRPLLMNVTVILILLTLLGLDGCLFPRGFLVSGSWEQLQDWYPNFYPLVAAASAVTVPALLSVMFWTFVRKVMGERHIASLLLTLVGLALMVAVQPIVGFRPLILTGIASALLVTGLRYLRCHVMTIRALLGTVFSTDERHTERVHLILWLLILLSAALRIVMVFLTDNAGHPDSACRYLHTQVWADYYLPSGKWWLVLNPSAQWPPLHFYISGLVYLLTGSATAIRVAHAIIGLISAGYVFRMAQLVGNNRTVTLISTLCFLIYPASISVSVQVLSEPFFLLFVLMATFHFLRITYSGDGRDRLFHIIAVNAAGLLRYEGWGIPFIFVFVLLLKNRKLCHRDVVTFMLSIIGPLCIMSINTFTGHGPLWGLEINALMVEYNYSLEKLNMATFIDGYRESWIPLAYLATIFCIPLFTGKKMLKWYSLICLLFTLPFVFNTFMGIQYPEARYVVHYEAMMIIPLSVAVCHVIFARIGRSAIGITLSCAAVAVLVSFGGVRDVNFPEGFQESIDHVNTSVTEGNFILDYHEGVAAYHWIADTRMPWLPEHHNEYVAQFVDFGTIRSQVDHAPTQFPKRLRYVVDHYDQAFRILHRKEIIDIMNRYDKVHVVIFPRGHLNGFLNLIQDTEYRFGHVMKRIFNVNGYMIYQVEKLPD